jgi:hypothetical protein
LVEVMESGSRGMEDRLGWNAFAWRLLGFYEKGMGTVVLQHDFSLEEGSAI